jgi:hypothetical protein
LSVIQPVAMLYGEEDGMSVPAGSILSPHSGHLPLTLPVRSYPQTPQVRPSHQIVRHQTA